MKITSAHREFWLLIKAPAFIRESFGIPDPKNRRLSDRALTIDALIPDGLNGKKLRAYINIANTLAILRHRRDRGEALFDAVRELALAPTSKDISKIHCGRWLRKMDAIRKSKYVPDYQI